MCWPDNQERLFCYLISFKETLCKTFWLPILPPWVQLLVFLVTRYHSNHLLQELNGNLISEALTSFDVAQPTW